MLIFFLTIILTLDFNFDLINFAISNKLYSFSIAIFNQWKGHKNILDFDVTVSGSDINIEVIYNDNIMDEILCQTFLNKKFESNQNYTEWKGEERFEKFGRIVIRSLIVIITIRTT